MKNQSQQLRSELDSLKKENNRMVERIAQKGLRCAKNLDGRDERDAMRLYINKAKSHSNTSSSQTVPDYEGNVLDNDLYENEDASLNSYSIINATKIKAESVDASIIDVTTIEAEEIRCNVLDARSVKTDNLQASVMCDYDTIESIQKIK